MCDQLSTYERLLTAQIESRELLPGSAEWLEATGRAQDAWAALQGRSHHAAQGDESSCGQEDACSA